jgi:formamidopyrimidine-DNA glycosylase
VPELPDLTVYIEALEARVLGQRLEGVRLASPFLLRSVEPPLAAFTGREVVGLRRLGKRIVFQFEDQHFLVLHLMIAGRLRWKARGTRPPGRVGLAVFDFPNGALVLTEASKQRRASLYAVLGEAALAEHDPGGLEPLGATPEQLREALNRVPHTLKRSLTDPRVLAGVGNAYSDEILHRAQLSPAKLAARLDDEELARLHAALNDVLQEWIARLREQNGGEFPDKVTAFHPEMAVHGRYNEPCPVCSAPVQRIVYAQNESNYCARCQTGGKLLADRALSRLLKQDWPRTLEELEAQRGRPRAGS